jgi:hypothetical protein
LRPWFFGLDSLFVFKACFAEGFTRVLGRLFREELFRFLSRIGQGHCWIVADTDTQAFGAAHDDPRLAVFSDADSECGRCFVEISAGRFYARHDYVSQMCHGHFWLRFGSQIA